MPTLIVFSHLRWDFVYQRPQHILSRLAKHFDVCFVEEPVATDGDPWVETSQAAPGVTLLRPHTPVAAPGFHDDQLPVLKLLLSNHLRDRKIDDCIAWFYTPMALPMLSLLSPRAVVYDCMDELSAFKHAPPQLRQRELALMKVADLVFTGGPSLYEAKRRLHPRVVCLPSAVDTAHYAPGRAAAQADAVTQARRIHDGIGRPRLGFFGVIDERLDIDLVAAIADAEASWQVVMVGPVVKIDPTALPRRANIHWLGQQPYDVLPQLVADWDVCLLPFALNESTRYISPTKTLEYMAAHKPVVSTAVHDVVAMYGDVVGIGHGPQGFVDRCRAALAESAAQRGQRIERMNAVVAEHTWDRAVEQVRAALEQVLAAAPHAGEIGASHAPPGAQRPASGNLLLAPPQPAPTSIKAA
ncbi:glycosyltransferase [Piscinibacter sp. XHJ-5]|uniref:glycosyltransferase n=1 Tax=Piscinibacter sp. XHJ-5 TaxID=3037797 RepID=UPI002452F876|nr:glycosyltransferase [Piscinibacter sp. XHJ-5]